VGELEAPVPVPGIAVTSLVVDRGEVVLDQAVAADEERAVRIVRTI
jgi:hypothetical protein